MCVGGGMEGSRGEAHLSSGLWPQAELCACVPYKMQITGGIRHFCQIFIFLQKKFQIPTKVEYNLEKCFENCQIPHSE